MKKILSLFFLSLHLIQTTWAQQSCPLTNSTLSDLRTSAAKLAKTITLSAECKSYQDTVNQANSELKKVAEEIAALEENQAASTPDLQATALHAVTQLDTISALFKDKRCGEELIGFLDYAETFVDVANGMTPFLALYGGSGAMPWVLGPALGGAAAKALITFFQNKSINMRNPDQSNVFIKNACSFHNLDLIKSSIDELQLNQFTKIERELIEARRRHRDLIKNAPQKPDSALVQRLIKAKEDKEKISYLKNQFKLDHLESCTYIEAFAAGKDERDGKTMVERVWENYEESITKASFRLELERDYFLNDLNAQAASMEDELCKSIGARWLNKIESISKEGISFLSKKVSEEPDMVAFGNWEKEKAESENSIKVLEAKIKFFREMTSEGFNIEYSEIIRSHQLVQDAIFESYKYLAVLKMKGLAEAWLQVKQEDAHREYRDFFRRKAEVEKRIQMIQKTVGASEDLSAESVYQFANNHFKQNQREHHEVYKSVLVDVCNQLRQTWNSWYNGLVHAKAGRDFCVTFDKVINKLDYPSVQRLCFGTSTKVGHKRSSLKNQLRDFHEIKPIVDEVVEKMEELSCQQRGSFSQELLKLPLE